MGNNVFNSVSLFVIFLKLSFFEFSHFFHCRIGPHPADCDSPETCVRGWNYLKYRWAFVYSLVWVSLAYMLVAMILVYTAVRKKELTSGFKNYFKEDVNINNQTGDQNLITRHHLTAEGGTSSNMNPSANIVYAANMNQLKDEVMKRKKSKRIMVQAFLYVGAVFATWSFATINRIIHTINGEMYPWLLVLGALFTPLQGVFNCLIYFRYKIAKWLKNKKQKGHTDEDGENMIKSNYETRLAYKDWLASRDKTGLAGANYSDSDAADANNNMGFTSAQYQQRVSFYAIDRQGEETQQEKEGHMIGETDVRPFNVSSSSFPEEGLEEQQETNTDIPDWIRQFSTIESINLEDDDGENDYY